MSLTGTWTPVKPPTQTDPKNADGVRSIARAAMLLRLLAAVPDQVLRLTDLAEQAGLHKVTARRLLTALVNEGLVDGSDRGYSLGPQAWLIGKAAGERYDLHAFAGPSVERVAATVGDVVLLAVQVGHTAVCLARAEGSYPIAPISVKPGNRRPLGAGAHALAMLAGHTTDRIDTFLAETENERAAFPRITTRWLREKIFETRKQGFALIDGDIVEGLTGVAIAIRDPYGVPLGALSCVAISSRLGPARRRKVVEVLRREVDQLEARLRRGTGADIGARSEPAPRPVKPAAARRRAAKKRQRKAK